MSPGILLFLYITSIGGFGYGLTAFIRVTKLRRQLSPYIQRAELQRVMREGHATQKDLQDFAEGGITVPKV